MSSFGQLLYKTVTRRYSTLILTVIVGAFAVEKAIVLGNDYYWEEHNKGKLWKDVKARLEAKGQ